MKSVRQRLRVAVGIAVVGVMVVVVVMSINVRQRVSISSSPFAGTTKMKNALIASHRSSASALAAVKKESVPTTSVVSTVSTNAALASPSTSVPPSVSSTTPSTGVATSSPQVLAPVLSTLSLAGETALGQSGAVVQYIWIYGSNFENATGVDFGAELTPIYARSGSSALEVAAPLQPLGTVNVRVVAGTLQSPVVPADTFSYVLAPQQ